MSWTKENPIKGNFKPCICCGVNEPVLDLGAIIAVGFGMATLEKNGKIIYMEENQPLEELMSVQQAEKIASKDPDNDWRIKLIGPLNESEYQRQGINHWVLYRTGKGFA